VPRLAWHSPCATGVVSLGSQVYEPRSPAAGVLYQIVRDHFETFRAQAAGLREGEGLPRFVEQAFRSFLRCGWLAGGFARFRCGRCGYDRLVPFSCKGRALCPSCAGRRMAERAAHLVDRVLPDVPIRQWVLSVPYRLRYRLAWDHDLCRAVAGVLVRSVLRVLRDRARDDGLEGGRGGAVVVIQRFGGALNLNVHFHALVLNGVFAGEAGTRRFYPVGPLTALDADEVLAAVEALVNRRLGARGDPDDESMADDPWAHDAPVLAGLAAASVQGVTGLAPRAGRTPTRFGNIVAGAPADALTHEFCAARANGYSLHAGLVVPARQRERLERVCRYVLRPPVAIERLQLTADGRVRLSLHRPWRDGTTDLVFTPLELLERLAVLVPRPRINLILYFGVLGARAAGRPDVVGPRRLSSATEAATAENAERAPDFIQPSAPTDRDNRSWATLMQRTFGLDVLACPRCGGRLRLIAFIEQPAVIARVLVHLGLPTELPVPRAARPPPDQAWLDERITAGDEADLFTPAS
jgi:Putative transposase/Transposase zinc-binding domain